METDSRIYVAGGSTLIGAAILRQLAYAGYTNLCSEAGTALDLTDPAQVVEFFTVQKPEYVFLAAGKTGGIEANRKFPAELMLDNLLVEAHLIHAAYHFQVKKLLYLASSCSYPRDCPQPMRVESLLTGSLEPTNEAYAVAKIAGIKLCQAYRRQFGCDFISAMPTNLYGPGDNFDPASSHVIPALLRKMHEAKRNGASQVEVWGTGKPRREFIYADDLAQACIFVMNSYNGQEPINLGCGSDLSIAELAELTREVVGFQGKLFFNTARPDGMPLKALDSSRLLSLGWHPATTMREALIKTLQAVSKNIDAS